MPPFDPLWAGQLAALESAGLRRALRPVEAVAAGKVRRNGQWLLDFSSNDYLGLSQDQRLMAAGAAAAEAWGAGARASRLVCGDLALHEEIEATLAAAKGSEAALLLPSGFQANATLLPALLEGLEHPLLFTDRLIHASLHHGIAAAGARQIRFRHNDLGHLENLLIKHVKKNSQPIIVVESVYSMDGDRADLPALAALAERFGALVYVDEAHATGLFGASGFGLTEGMANRLGLVMGTFGKALGVFGAYVCCSKTLRDYLVNRCAGLIYATALPPFVLGAVKASLALIPGMGQERAQLQTRAADLRARLEQAGFSCGPSTTQIVPVLVGTAERATALSAKLAEQGILGVSIRPPTVPPGTARLRFSVTAAHDDDDIIALVEALTMAARTC